MEDLNLEKLDLKEPKLENLGDDEVGYCILTVHNPTSGLDYKWRCSPDIDLGSCTALILGPEGPAQCTSPVPLSSMPMRIRILFSRMPDYILVEMVIKWGPVGNQKKLRIFRPASMGELEWAGAGFDLRTGFTLGEWQYSAHFVDPAISTGDTQKLTLVVAPVKKDQNAPLVIVASNTRNGIEIVLCRYQNGACHGKCDACHWAKTVVPLTSDEMTALMAGKESMGSVGVKEV